MHNTQKYSPNQVTLSEKKVDERKEQIILRKKSPFFSLAFYCPLLSNDSTIFLHFFRPFVHSGRNIRKYQKGGRSQKGFEMKIGAKNRRKCEHLRFRGIENVFIEAIETKKRFQLLLMYLLQDTFV
jgi:hypothetical protein